MMDTPMIDFQCFANTLQPIFAIFDFRVPQPFSYLCTEISTVQFKPERTAYLA